MSDADLSRTKRSPSPTPAEPNKQQRTLPHDNAATGSLIPQEATVIPPSTTADTPAPEEEKEAAPAAATTTTEDDAPAPAAAPTRPSSRAQGVKLDSLKSLSQLYQSQLLEPVEEGESTTYPHDQQLNDKVILWRGDITKLEVDCIVNAANSSLLGGGGVDGAIHSAAGPTLYEECKTLNGAETGQVKLTGGHRLPALHIAHAVGPIYSKSRKEESEGKLRECYQGTLKLVVENGLKSVAFSGISTGIYGYPLDAATSVALDETRKFLASDDGAKLDAVIFTVFRQIDVDSYVEGLPYFFPPPPFPSDIDEEPTTTTTETDSAAAPPKTTTDGVPDVPSDMVVDAQPEAEKTSEDVSVEANEEKKVVEEETVAINEADVPIVDATEEGEKPIDDVVLGR